MTEHWRWIEANRRMLERHCGEWVALAEGQVISHSPDLGTVMDAGRASGKVYWLFKVPTSWRRVRIYPVRLRSLHVSAWEPVYPVLLRPGTPFEVRVEMLVDSGADASCISRSLGERLGLARAPGETLEAAEGVGSSLQYVGRDVEMDVDGHRMTAPVAWLQEGFEIEPILGRAVVFDCFDVLIRQRDRDLQLVWRGPVASA